MRLRQRPEPVALCFAALLLVSAVAGWSQEPAEDPAEDQDAADDVPLIEDEIEVTAQRFEESVQDVPISVEVLSGDAIERQGIADVHALADAAPGVVVSGQSAQTGEISVFIRGVGSNTGGLGVESSVAYYVDGVYMPRSQSFLGAFFDLERAEVLRGPQGSLWGRNATGGAINLVTRAPEAEFHGAGRASFGRFDSPGDAAGRRYGLTLTGPLTPNLWARISGTAARVDNATWNDHLKAGNRNVDGFSGRMGLTFLPSDTLTFTVRADVTDDGSHHNFHLKPGDTSSDSVVGALVGFYGLSDPTDVHRAVSGEQPVSAFEAGGFSLHARKTLFGGALSMSSITSAREFDSNRRADVDGTSLAFVDSAGDYDSEWWSQELQVQGGKDRARFVLGVFGFGEKGRHLTQLRTDPALAVMSLVVRNSLLFDLDPVTFCGVRQPTVCGPAYYEMLARRFGLPLPGTLTPVNKFDTVLDSESYASYGQVDVAFSDRLTLTTGLRYSRDEKDFSLTTLPLVTTMDETPEFETQSRSDSWRSVTPKIGLEFRPRDDLLLYAAASTGYKSGGFNAVAFQPSFGPETVSSYELGFKVSSAAGVTLNASAFSYNYDDLQVEVFEIDHSFAQNAGNARARGIDLDLRVRPNPRLTFDLSAEFLDDEFENFSSLDPVLIAEATDFALGAFNLIARAQGILDVFTVIDRVLELREEASRRFELAGNSLMRAPDLSATASVAYSVNLRDRGSLAARGEFQFTDEFSFDPFERFTQPGYSLFHGNLRWSSPGNKYSVNLYGRNLGDQEYRLNEFHTSYTGSLRVWAPPREVGVLLGWDF